MKRKYYTIKTIAVLITVISMVSCQKKLDEAFTNPNAGSRVPTESLLPGIISNMGGSSAAAGSAYGTANDGMNIGRYVQYWATNTSGNQFDQMGGATGSSDLMGSVWAMHYYGISEMRLLSTPLPVMTPFFWLLKAVASSLKYCTSVPGSGPSNSTFALPS